MYIEMFECYGIRPRCKILCNTDRIAYSGLTRHVDFNRHSDLSDGEVCYDEIIKKHMKKIKNRLKGNRIVKVLSLLAALVMPLYFLTMFVVILITGDFDTAGILVVFCTYGLRLIPQGVQRKAMVMSIWM